MGRDRVLDICFCATGEMMKNRWGYDIRRGMEVIAHMPRGGTEIGKIAKVEKTGAMARAYGPRVILQSGASYGIDDVSPAIATTMQPPMKETQAYALGARDPATVAMYRAKYPELRKNPSRRVKSHLLHDISESANGIARDVKLLKNPARRIGIREAREMGRTAGFNAASWVDLPDIGAKVRTDADGRYTIDKNNMWDFVQSMAYEGEANSRNYSPFEFTAHAFNESRNSDALWSAYDDGVSKGIAENIRQRKAAMRGIPRRRKNPSRRVTRAVAGKFRVEWSTNGKDWHSVQGLKNLNRATAHAAAKQIHKSAPSRWVRVVP